MKVVVFWDVMVSELENICRRFEGLLRPNSARLLRVRYLEDKGSICENGRKTSVSIRGGKFRDLFVYLFLLQ
jgi:hypothetical protein